MCLFEFCYYVVKYRQNVSFCGEMCSYLFLFKDCQCGGGGIRKVPPPKYSETGIESEHWVCLRLHMLPAM